MNREIKFRVWGDFGNSSGEFTYIYHCGHHNPSLNDIFNQKEFIFQQYTGLKDKNGKEIYEGDLIRDKYGALYEVCWIDTEASFEFAIRNEDDNLDYDFTHCNALSISFSKAEIVGNIFETSKLLNHTESFKQMGNENPWTGEAGDGWPQ